MKRTALYAATTRAALALALMAIASLSPAASPLPRLAAAMADEIVRVAAGRAVELVVPEDRTGRGGAFSLDLHALVLARLEGHTMISPSGPRLRIIGVVSETAGRLVLSARVVEQPGGRLLDLLSVSAATDETVLDLLPLAKPAPRAAVEVVTATRTPPLEGPILDVAFAGEERLAVLAPDALSLYRWDGGTLTLESRRALPSTVAARLAAGRILAPPGESSLWVMTNRSPVAHLFDLEGGHLAPRQQAAALPWPGSPTGVRYRLGTDLLEGTLAGLGPGPFLGLEPTEGRMAVSPEGRLLESRSESAPAGPLPEPRVGPPIARLWTRLVAASSPEPPGARDALLVLARATDDVGGDETVPLRSIETVPVEGAIRALAGRTRGDSARLVLALEEPQGEAHLLVLDLRRGQP